jgi:4-amino-4-deoxy-L-arabinose transferase-like glycosyltransferase
MVAWWIWLSTHVLGDTALGIRMPAILSALVTSLAVFGTARQLFLADSIGLRAVLWFNAMILIGVGVIFGTPDAPSTMFWALSLWALAAIWRTRRPSLWLLVGLFTGLGCLSKYTNLFLGLGIVAWLLADPVARRWLLSPWLWAGGLIAVVMFLPVFVWNAEHDWISFHRQFGRLAMHGITLRYLSEFVLCQLGLLNPIIAFFGLLAGAAVLRERAEARRGPYLMLLATMAPLLVYMIIHAVHDRVQGNWLTPIYPQVAILAAAYADRQGMHRFSLWFAQAVAPLGIGLSTIILIYLACPYGPPLSIPNPGDRLEGWQNFATAIEQLREKSGASWIATANYDVNAELAFWERGYAPVREIAERERYSFSSLDTFVNQPAILVLSERQKTSGRFDHCFFSVSQPISTLSRRGAAGPIERYVVQRVRRATSDINRGCRAAF